VLLRTCFHAFHRDCFSDLETDECPDCQSDIKSTCEISLEQFEGDDYPQILKKISNLCQKSNVVYRDQIYPFEISPDLPIREVFECLSKKIGFDLGDSRISFPYEAKMHHGPELIDTSPVYRELGFSKTDLDEPFGWHEWVKVRSAKTVRVHDRFGRSFDVKYLENEDIRVFKYRLAVELSGLTDELKRKVGSHTASNHVYFGGYNRDLNFFMVYMDYLGLSKDVSFNEEDPLIIPMPHPDHSQNIGYSLSLNKIVELIEKDKELKPRTDTTDATSGESTRSSIAAKPGASATGDDPDDFPSLGEDGLTAKSKKPAPTPLPFFNPSTQIQAESGPKVDRFELDKYELDTMTARELKKRTLKTFNELLSLNSKLGKSTIFIQHNSSGGIDYVINFDSSFEPLARLKSQSISIRLNGQFKEPVALYVKKLDSSSASSWMERPYYQIRNPPTPRVPFALYKFRRAPARQPLLTQAMDIPEDGDVAVVDLGEVDVAVTISFGGPFLGPQWKSLTGEFKFKTPGSAPVYLVKERIARMVSELSDDLYRHGILTEKPSTVDIDLERLFLSPSDWITVGDQEMIAFHNRNTNARIGDSPYQNKPAQFTVSVLP
jgi:hypothetical protein